MLNIKIVVVCILLISINPAWARNEYSKSPIPHWVEQINISKQSSMNSSEASHGVKFLLVDEQINFSASKKVRYYHYAQKIENESGLKSASQITIDFDPAYQRLQLHFIRILRGSKIINMLDTAKISLLQRETNLENSEFDGRKSATIILEDVRVGDIVEYSFSRIGNNPAFGRKLFEAMDLQWSVPVSKVYYKIITKKLTKLYFKSHSSLAVFKKHSTGEHWIFTYKAQNVAALHSEAHIPQWYDPYPWIQISSFNQWQDVEKWALSLFLSVDTPSKKIHDAALKLIRKESSPEQQILTILKFVQDDIRYTAIEMGVSAYRPNRPEVVLARRFGDCKDKVVLLVSMLRSLDFTAYPVLVNSRMRSNITNLLPSATNFNHVVTLVEFNGKKYWLDPTINAQFGNLDTIFEPDYGYGLILRNGETSLAEFTPIKKSQLDEKIFETFEVNYDDVPTIYKIKTEYFGNSADNIRYYFNNNGKSQIAKEYLNYAAKYYPSIKFISNPRIVDDKDKNVVTVFEEYGIGKFWKLLKNTKRYRAQFYQPNLDEILRVTNYAKRSMPLAIARKREILIQTNILLKDNWPIKASNKRIIDPAFLFEKTVIPEGNNFQINYRYKSLADFVPPDLVVSYTKNIEEARNILGYYISTTRLNNVEADPSARKLQFSLNWEIVFVFFMSVIIAIAVNVRIYKYDPEPNLTFYDEKTVGIRGWLILPAIGLILICLNYLRSLSLFIRFIDINKWNALTLPASEMYDRMYAPIINGELITNVIMFCFVVTLTILFYKKRTSVPRLYIAYLVINTLVRIIDHLFAMQIHSAVHKSNPQALQELYGAVFSSLIWLLYFIKSRRVSSTFTRRLYVSKPATG